jgi:hypothetical protein
MFRDEPSDRGQDALEIAQIQRPHRVARGDAELQDHEPRAGLEHPRRFFQPGVEIGQIAHPESDRGAVEDGSSEGKREGVGIAGRRAIGLAAAQQQHGLHEVGGEDPSPEIRPVAQLGGQVHRPRTEVEIGPFRRPFPAKPVHRKPPPAAVEVEAENMIEQVVPRRDGREYPPDVGPLLGPAGDR